jgi:hypothetical protein
LATDVQLFTFSASSKGGIGAIGVLSKAYGQQMRQRPGQYPVIILGVSSYMHSNRTLGRIKYPTFEIKDWVPTKPFVDLLGKQAQDPMTSTAIATTDTTKNAFEIYGDAASPNTIVGQLLKFSKGDYVAGQQGEEIPMGTLLVAIMDSLRVGWVKWENNRPVEQLMGLLVDGYQPARRKDLGDEDSADWETNDDGSARDPWQLTNQLVMSSVPTGLLSKPTPKSAA